MQQGVLGEQRIHLWTLILKRKLSHDTHSTIVQRINKEKQTINGTAADSLAEKIIAIINESKTEEEILQKMTKL